MNAGRPKKLSVMAMLRYSSLRVVLWEIVNGLYCEYYIYHGRLSSYPLTIDKLAPVMEQPLKVELHNEISKIFYLNVYAE